MSNKLIYKALEEDLRVSNDLEEMHPEYLELDLNIPWVDIEKAEEPSVSLTLNLFPDSLSDFQDPINIDLMQVMAALNKAHNKEGMYYANVRTLLRQLLLEQDLDLEGVEMDLEIYAREEDWILTIDFNEKDSLKLYNLWKSLRPKEYTITLTEKELNLLDESYQEGINSDVVEGHCKGTIEDLGLKIIAARKGGGD